MTPYRPARWLPGADLQTIVPALRSDTGPDGAERMIRVPVGDDSSVRLDGHRPAGPARGTLLLLHGMGGSSHSGYMLATAREGVARGWVVWRMNLRNCGGTEAWAHTLYNAGQSEDAGGVLARLAADTADHPRPHVAVGFSLGGNIVMRHAGLAGDGCSADVVAAVNPPVDLEHCLQALERPRNRLYEIHYVRRLCAQLQAIRRCREVPGPPAHPGRIGRLRRFDALFTAPDAGFPSAEAYYEASSAAPVLGAIARPALILSAANDPFVPVEMFRGIPANVTRLHPAAGGHCGYWQSGRPRNWAASALIEWIESSVRRGPGTSQG